MSNAVTNQNQEDKTLRQLISSFKEQFATALPKHLTPDRFIRIALTALTKTPKLASCTQASVMSCLLDLSQMGLEPDGRKAHLIPYGNQCTLVVDYKGLVELARRSGEVVDVHADVVYENDFFEFEHGTNAKLTHKPTLKERGRPIAFYSCVRLKDGSTSFEIMTITDVESIRQRSKAKDSGPWKTDYSEMGKKTVFRRHSKWLPVSSEFQDAVEKDFDTPDFPGQVIDTTSLMPREKQIDLNQGGDPPTAGVMVNRISQQQAADLQAYVNGNDYTQDEVSSILKQNLDVEKISDLPADQVDKAISLFPQKARRR